MDMQTLARNDTPSAAGVRGIIDIRAYASRVAPSSDWLKGRAAPAFADDAATVAAIAPVGEGRVAALAADEFVIVPVMCREVGSWTFLPLRSDPLTTSVEAADRSVVTPDVV